MRVFGLKIGENQYQKQLDDAGDYAKPRSLDQLKPALRQMAKELESDPIKQKNIIDHLEMAADMAAKGGMVSIKDVVSLQESMDLLGSISSKGQAGVRSFETASGLLANLMIAWVKAGSPEAPKEPDFKAVPLSVAQIDGVLQKELAQGGIDQKKYDQMFIALSLAADETKTGTLTINQMETFATKTKELSDFVSGETKARQAAGLKPTLQELQSAASLAGTYLGALQLNQYLLYSAQSGSLSKLAASVEPGAKDQLGAAFGG